MIDEIRSKEFFILPKLNLENKFIYIIITEIRTYYTERGSKKNAFAIFFWK